MHNRTNYPKYFRRNKRTWLIFDTNRVPGHGPRLQLGARCSTCNRFRIRLVAPKKCRAWRKAGNKLIMGLPARFTAPFTKFLNPLSFVLLLLFAIVSLFYRKVTASSSFFLSPRVTKRNYSHRKKRTLKADRINRKEEKNRSTEGRRSEKSAGGRPSFDIYEISFPRDENRRIAIYDGTCRFSRRIFSRRAIPWRGCWVSSPATSYLTDRSARCELRYVQCDRSLPLSRLRSNGWHEVAWTRGNRGAGKGEFTTEVSRVSSLLPNEISR